MSMTYLRLTPGRMFSDDGVVNKTPFLTTNTLELQASETRPSSVNRIASKQPSSLALFFIRTLPSRLVVLRSQWAQRISG